MLGLCGAKMGEQDPHCGKELSAADKTAVEEAFVSMFDVKDFARSVTDDINQQDPDASRFIAWDVLEKVSANVSLRPTP